MLDHDKCFAEKQQDGRGGWGEPAVRADVPEKWHLNKGSRNMSKGVI